MIFKIINIKAYILCNKIHFLSNLYVIQRAFGKNEKAIQTIIIAMANPLINITEIKRDFVLGERLYMYLKVLI
jgi:hypothetical protein